MPPDCTKPYSASVFNISAMSFGALSPNAVRALNAGAKKGGFAHDTGEGGVSPYHRENGGDLIWEIGSGYFGAATSTAPSILTSSPASPVTREQAIAGLQPILQDIQQREPDAFPKQWTLKLQDFGETFPSDIKDALWILFAAVGLLLLIACVNVSNLLLSRAALRRREMAVRAAIGAPRSRIIRQLLSESLLLAAIGGLLGIAVGGAALRGIIAMVPPNTIPDEAQITLNLPVLLFTLGVSVAAALLFGIAPALQLSGRDILAPLREAGRGNVGSTRQRLLLGSLVVGEVALSVMLLVGASLMIRSLISIQGKDLGFHPDRILTLRIPVSDQRYKEPERRAALLQDVLQRIRSVPGARAVSINWGLPPVFAPGWPVTVVGSTQTDTGRVLVQQTDHQYLDTMGIALQQGRFLEAPEVNAKQHSAVVNQTFVRRYFSGAPAIGRLVRIPALRQAPWNLTDDAFQIVGVIKDTVNQIGANEIAPEMYLPFTILNRADRIFVLSSGAKAESLDKAIKAQIYAADPSQPVMDDKSMEAVLGENAYARPRFNLLLFTVFAALGLILAIFGIYGVVSHNVAQQTREIGIRIALGASFSQVIAMVLSLGARLHRRSASCSASRPASPRSKPCPASSATSLPSTPRPSPPSPPCSTSPAFSPPSSPPAAPPAWIPATVMRE